MQSYKQEEVSKGIIEHLRQKNVFEDVPQEKMEKIINHYVKSSRKIARMAKKANGSQTKEDYHKLMDSIEQKIFSDYDASKKSRSYKLLRSLRDGGITAAVFLAAYSLGKSIYLISQQKPVMPEEIMRESILGASFVDIISTMVSAYSMSKECSSDYGIRLIEECSGKKAPDFMKDIRDSYDGV